MNLYDFSQINNDEMGIYVTKKHHSSLYNKIIDEAKFLCKDFYSQDVNHENLTIRKKEPLSNQNIKTASLTIGQNYSYNNLKTIFLFTDDHFGGIKETINGDIILFSKSKSKYKT